MRQETREPESARTTLSAPVFPDGSEKTSPLPALHGEVPCRDLSIAALVAACQRELDAYHRGEPCREAYGLELFRRATMQADAQAWAGLYQCFHGMVRTWLHRHPNREVACRLESEENYIAQAFERFWQATALRQQLEFAALATALRYLRASLHGAVMDTLRLYARAREIPLPQADEPGEPGEPETGEEADSGELWEVLQTMLPDRRERRVAYLLFRCGLKPREIIRFCPHEFSDIREIYSLRRNIMERLLRNADHLRWRLTTV